MRRQIGSVTTGHSPDKNQRSRDFRKRNGIVSGCYAIICACWSIGKQHTPHSRRMPSGILFLWKALQRISYTEYLWIFVIRRNRRKAALIAAQGKEVLRLEQRISELAAGNAGSGQKDDGHNGTGADTGRIRETLEGTQKGGVKNSIRNCLTVFQRDPLFRGALRLNLLTEQIDIVKPLGWERTSTTLTDMDMNYLLCIWKKITGLPARKGAERHQDCCQ